MRVAYTLEQCWHDVPGGTATSMLRLAQELSQREDTDLIGVAGRHRRPPVAGYEPTIPMTSLPLARPWLYESWRRLKWPLVESATGAVDVCHSTAGIPAPSNAPHVVTLHDVAFLRRPDRLTRQGVRVLTNAVERSRSAAAVTCPSTVVHDDLVAAGFPDDQVHVVPWGVDAVDVRADDISAVRDLYGLPSEFVLAVATLEPRKNLRRLIEAHQPLTDVPPLVIAGPPGWGEVADDLQASSQHVVFLGHVRGDHLRALYAAANVLAYPSEEEGFGLPVLEAMAAGTPVVTSRGTATEEVAGGAAELVDPFDLDSIGHGITSALNNAEQLRVEGLDRARECTWERSASAMMAVYQAVKEHNA
ncbi:MAG: glycosyltransferase family 4 protein [Ilumatobacteraceae bacterium]